MEIELSELSASNLQGMPRLPARLAEPRKELRVVTGGILKLACGSPLSCVAPTEFNLVRFNFSQITSCMVSQKFSIHGGEGVRGTSREPLKTLKPLKTQRHWPGQAAGGGWANAAGAFNSFGTQGGVICEGRA